MKHIIIANKKACDYWVEQLNKNPGNQNALNFLKITLKNMELMSEIQEHVKEYGDPMHYIGDYGDIKNTEIDNILLEMQELFAMYISAKEGYRMTASENDKLRMLGKLEDMLILHGKARAEVQKCIDCEEEKQLIVRYMSKMS